VLVVRVKIGEEVLRSNIRVRVRFDYKGIVKTNRFFFGGKPTEKIAIDCRQQQESLLRNVPLQGIYIDEINSDMPLYMVYDQDRDETVAYAPMEVTLSADTIADIIHFVMREEFRKIEILEPEHICVSRYDAERFLFQANETMRSVATEISKKASGK
jgi:hypothetical protein